MSDHPLSRVLALAKWLPPCRRAGAAAIVLAGLAAPAGGQNLVQNGSFQSDTTGWALGGFGTLTWSPVDRRANPGSGSLTASQEAPGAGTTFLAAYCLPASPGTFALRAFTLVPSGQARTGSVKVSAAARGGAGCTSTTLTAVASASDATVGSWRTHEAQLTVPAGAASVSILLQLTKNEAGGALVARLDDVFFGKPCVASATQLCLDSQRFGVSTTWTTPDSQTGKGVATAFTGEAGYFWFFAPGNVEIVVKEIDACTYNGRHWIYLSGLTDVAVHVVVTDFETNQVKVYSNPQGHSFTPVLDSSAFATCP